MLFKNVAKLFLVLFALCTVVLAQPALAGVNKWTSTNGPEEVFSLAVDPITPATLYAGTSRGVFKSTDGGASWSAVNTGLSHIDADYADIRSFIVNPITRI